MRTHRYSNTENPEQKETTSLTTRGLLDQEDANEIR